MKPCMSTLRALDYPRAWWARLRGRPCFRVQARVDDGSTMSTCHLTWAEALAIWRAHHQHPGIVILYDPTHRPELDP